MIVRVTRQAPERTSFRHVNELPQRFDDDEKELDIEPIEQNEKRGRGRPRTERGAWIAAYIKKHKCSKHKAGEAATAAGYPSATRVVQPKTGPKKKRKRRAAPVVSNRIARRPITILMPIYIIEKFKEQGAGYQTRMIEELARCVRG